MRNYVQQGNILTLTLDRDVVSGELAIAGAIVGVATGDVPAGVPGEFEVVGVYDLPAANAALAQGAKAYWDATNKVVTGTAADNVLIGAVVLAKAAGVAVARVRLNGTV